MSAEIESLFFVREVPWHGLGTKLEDCPTSKDAIIAAGLDWNVNSKPIFDSFGNEIPRYRANTRDSDNSVLGIVSNKYQIVQNADAFEFTDSLIGNGVTYETAGSLKSGKTIWLLAKLEGTTIAGDDIDPYICFTNTHDGTGSIKVCMTPVRVVCCNTLNFALQSASRTWSAKHMSNIFSKLQEAKHTLGLANNYMTELKEMSEHLATIPFSKQEFEKVFDAMYPINYVTDSKRKIDNIEAVKDSLFKCYNAADLNNFRDTKYGALMAVTDMVAHSAPGRMTQNWQENNWGKIMVGHPVVDEFYKRIVA